MREGGSPDGGTWVDWSWDGSRLVVRNDDFAAFPLFTWVDGDALVLAGSIDRVLALGAPRELDDDALAAFLTTGHHIDTDTVFRHIRTLPPASELVWQRGRTSIESRPWWIRYTDMPRADAIDGVIELTRQAFRRRLADGRRPRLHPLSGGRDSRHLLLELSRQGARPDRVVTTRHMPYDWSGDVPYAARLAARLGIPHVVTAPRAPLAVERAKNRATSYGSVQHGWYTAVAEAVDGATDVVYDGNPGGTLFARLFRTRRVAKLIEARAWDELAAKSGKKDEEGRPRYLPLLSPAVRGRLGHDVATARIRAGIARHEREDDPYIAFRFRSRAMRELMLTATGMLSRVTVVHTPFLDRDLLRFGASIPHGIVQSGFHDEVIARAYPEVADVPFRPKTRPRSTPRYRRLLAKGILRTLIERSDGSLLDRPALIRQAARSAATGDDWFMFGRRFPLLIYLAQLEAILAGRDRSPQEADA